jgi:hypothetical protein
MATSPTSVARPVGGSGCHRAGTDIRSNESHDGRSSWFDAAMRSLSCDQILTGSHESLRRGLAHCQGGHSGTRKGAMGARSHQERTRSIARNDSKSNGTPGGIRTRQLASLALAAYRSLPFRFEVWRARHIRCRHSARYRLRRVPWDNRGTNVYGRDFLDFGDLRRLEPGSIPAASTN